MLARFRDRADDDVAMLALRLRGRPVHWAKLPPGRDMARRARSAVFEVMGELSRPRTARRRGVVAVVVGQLVDRLAAHCANGCELLVYQLGRGLRFEIRETGDRTSDGREVGHLRFVLDEAPFAMHALRVGVLDAPATGFWCETEWETIDD